MAYTFDPIFAADPSNPANVAANAAILIYDPNDAGKAPVTITDLTGSPLPNPVTVNKNGFGSAFQHATLDRLAWSGAGFEGFFTSYEGMKNVAVAARAAAETAAANAAVAAAEGVAPVVAEAEAAAASASAAEAAAASSATAAANSAALVGAPADTAIAAAINGTGTATKAALTATYATTAAITPKLDKTEAATTYRPKANAKNTAAVKPLQTWLTALAARDQAKATAVVIGDSVTEGVGALNFGSTWVTRFTQQLRQLYPTRGIRDGGQGYIPTFLTSVSIAGLPVTIAGTTGNVNENGLGMKCTYLDSAGDSITVTFTGTALDVLYLKGGSGTARITSYTVDGGAATTFDTQGAVASPEDTGIQRINCGTSGTHTVVLAYSSGGASYIEGFWAYDGDENKGVHVLAAGHGGWRTSNYLAVPGGETITRHYERVASVNPSLIIMALGENDYLHGRTVSEFKTNLQTYITGQRAAITGTQPDIAILMAFEANAAGANVAPWADFVTAAKEVAAADTTGMVVIDLTEKMPSVATDTLGMYVDAYHPRPRGHQLIARAVTESVAPW